MSKDLIKEKEINSHLMELSNDPVIMTDEVTILFSNRRFNEILNDCSLTETINSNFTNLKKLLIKEDGISLDGLNLKDIVDKAVKINLLNTNSNKKYTFILKCHYLTSCEQYLIYLNDVTLELEYEIDKHKLLYTDRLTSLPNRIKLIEELKIGEVQAQSLTIIDIVSFKEINDFFGNKNGDMVLSEVANIILDIIKDYKHLSLYKFPSDTYCIINLDKDNDSFIEIVKNIVNRIDSHSFFVDNNDINVRVRAGISFSEKNNKLITADLALQAAKKDGKDYLVFFDKLDNLQEYQNNIQWTKKIKQALENDKIIVYFQPLINNDNLKIEKYECLVRLIDNDKVISPYFFLDISKKCNQYNKITKVVIEKSCKTFSNLNFEFSVNISYEDIIEPTFFDFIKSMFEKYDIKNKIVFEILEDQSIKDYDYLINFISEVKKLGCKIAIDDFGSGYSNFEHLLKMDIDYLKIDASLIKNIANNTNSYKVTKTVIEFAKSLNLKTIAEFVENKEIFDVVKDLGSNYSQGYYFSAPLEKPSNE